MMTFKCVIIKSLKIIFLLFIIFLTVFFIFNETEFNGDQLFLVIFGLLSVLPVYIAYHILYYFVLKYLGNPDSVWSCVLLGLLIALFLGCLTQLYTSLDSHSRYSYFFDFGKELDISQVQNIKNYFLLLLGNVAYSLLFYFFMYMPCNNDS